MTPREPMPELCKHADVSQCSAECEEKAARFDEWIREWIKEGDTHEMRRMDDMAVRVLVSKAMARPIHAPRSLLRAVVQNGQIRLVKP